MKLNLASLLLLSFVAIAVSRSYNVRKGMQDKRKDADKWFKFIRLIVDTTQQVGKLFDWWKRNEGNPGSLSVDQEIMAFNILDQNKDGYIDMDELTNDLHKIMPGGIMTAEELMEEADTNNDNKLDIEELFDVIANEIKHKQSRRRMELRGYQEIYY